MQQVAKNIFYVADFLFGTNCKLNFFYQNFDSLKIVTEPYALLSLKK